MMQQQMMMQQQQMQAKMAEMAKPRSPSPESPPPEPASEPESEEPEESDGDESSGERRWVGYKNDDDNTQFPKKASTKNPLKFVYSLRFDNQYDFEFENEQRTRKTNRRAKKCSGMDVLKDKVCGRVTKIKLWHKGLARKIIFYDEDGDKMLETRVKQDNRWENECDVETIDLEEDEVIIGVRGDHSAEYKGR